MITFWIGAMIGCVVGVGTVCFMAVAAEEDRWLEKKANRCSFCGGKLSEVRYTKEGKPYRYCYGCHFDKYIIDEYVKGD